MSESEDSASLFDKAQDFGQSGRYPEAITVFDLLIRRHPLAAEVHAGRATAMLAMERHDEAIEGFTRALALNPTDATSYDRQGVALQTLGRISEAIDSYKKALVFKPRSVETIFNLATALAAQGKLQEAIACYDSALELQPNLVPAIANRGMAFMELGVFERATEDLDRAHALAGTAMLRFNRATLELLTGDFDNGWENYEFRKQRPVAPIVVPAVARPEWRGETLEGKTLLLHAEQGLGDTIQFCRYAILAAQGGAQVILSVPKELVRLLQGIGPNIRVVDEKSPAPPSDFHAMLLSMPLAFGTNLKTIPAPIPYLSAEPERVDAWDFRLGQNGFKVGIAWQGDPQSFSAAGRSFPLASFEPLSRIPGVRLISLQKGAGTEQLEHLPSGMRVETLGADFDSGPDAFLDSAAVMRNLDLVISADTAIAHLAGALGARVWVALKYVPDWRWLLNRNNSPWYPSMRLFRQNHRDDWQSVFACMAAELATIASRV